MTKQCTICKEVKIHIGNSKKGYFDEKHKKWNHSWCPQCTSEYNKNYTLNNNLLKGGYGSAPCKICGVIFERKSSRHVYCSLECKEKR